MLKVNLWLKDILQVVISCAVGFLVVLCSFCDNQAVSACEIDQKLLGYYSIERISFFQREYQLLGHVLISQCVS